MLVHQRVAQFVLPEMGDTFAISGGSWDQVTQKVSRVNR